MSAAAWLRGLFKPPAASPPPGNNPVPGTAAPASAAPSPPWGPAPAPASPAREPDPAPAPAPAIDAIVVHWACGCRRYYDDAMTEAASWCCDMHAGGDPDLIELAWRALDAQEGQ